jgi:hypothetical protein
MVFINYTVLIVAITPGIPDVSTRHEPEIKGGLKALRDKGQDYFYVHATKET